MISIFEKVRLPQLRKEKYSILASMLHIFLNFFLTEPHTYFYNTLVFLYLALNLETFFK